MKRRAALRSLLAAITLSLCPVSEASGREIIFKVSNIATISLEDVVKDLRKARVVVVGEQHDNRLHHEAQLTVIRLLREAGVKVAIGCEMFRADSQADLDRWVAGELSPEEFFRVYADNWGIDWWPVYRDIFYYARKHKVPLVGLNVPRPIVRQVAKKGFESLSAKQRGKIKVAACDVDATYQRTLGAVLGQKQEGGALFDRFCQAQVVWDTAMALNTLEYAENNPDSIIVVLAGNFHAWKRGIPEQIERRSELPVRVILPSSDSSFFRYDIVLEDADYVWWHE